MNTPAEGQSTLPPAASTLLFQAPQFVEPVVKEKAPALERGERPEDTTKPAGRRGGQQGQPARASGKSSGAQGGGGASEGKKKSEKPKAKKGKTGSSDGAGKNASKQGDASGKDASTQSEGGAPEKADQTQNAPAKEAGEGESGSTRRRRRRPRSAARGDGEDTQASDEVQGLKGSTRLEAKRMRRREGRREGRRRQSITEAEFLARRESVDREMVVRHKDGLDQIAVLEDGLLVEHYVARKTQQSIVGNIYLGRVQNVLPSMEAAFVDIGKGRNAVLYAGEVNWDSLGMEGKPRRIEQALKSGDTVLVQVTKDPIGHKGARLTSQVTLAGRFLVLVPGSSMLGISRRLPDTERARLKKILKEAVPKDAGVIVRTAAEGATEEQLKADVDRLVSQWESIQRKEAGTRKAPQLLRGEPELVVRVIRDIFNEDFKKLAVQGDPTWETVSDYVSELSPDLQPRLEKWTSKEDIFAAKRIDQQLAKGMDRKVWLPSGGTLVIDRTEALTVVDINTGKYIGSGGTLEETVTRNNLEAAEEIVRQLRLRDIGGIIIIDFVDMVLESNRELVMRRLVECLGRDRTRHQVTEITSLGLVQMTRKRVGEGLVEAFSTTCEVCDGRGFIVHDHPVEIEVSTPRKPKGNDGRGGAGRGRAPKKEAEAASDLPVSHVGEEKVKTALSAIAAATVKPGAEDQSSAAAETPAAPPAQTAESSARKGPRRRRVATAAPTEAQSRPAQDEQSSSGPAEVGQETGRKDIVKSAPAGEQSLIESATRTLDQNEEARTKVVSDAPRPRRRRKVVAESAAPEPGPSPRKRVSEGESEDDKRDSAKEAVQDLLNRERTKDA